MSRLLSITAFRETAVLPPRRTRNSEVAFSKAFPCRFSVWKKCCCKWWRRHLTLLLCCGFLRGFFDARRCRPYSLPSFHARHDDLLLATASCVLRHGVLHHSKRIIRDNFYVPDITCSVLSCCTQGVSLLFLFWHPRDGCIYVMLCYCRR